MHTCTHTCTRAHTHTCTHAHTHTYACTHTHTCTHAHTHACTHTQVKVRDIHVRYEDSETNPNTTIAAGITLHSLELKVRRVIEPHSQIMVALSHSQIMVALSHSQIMVALSHSQIMVALSHSQIIHPMANACRACVEIAGYSVLHFEVHRHL